MKLRLIALPLVLSAAVTVPAIAQDRDRDRRGKGQEVIQLPRGFGPEGITTSDRDTFFVGGRQTGAIYRGSLRTGQGRIIVQGREPSGPVPDDRAATGLKVDDRNRLFVSGADSKVIRIYDAGSGRELRTYPVPEAGFINDVILTPQGAYFTDSQVQQLYFIPFERGGRLGELQRIPITGDFVYGPGFNANGIEAARGGRVLIAIKSSTGELFQIDPRTGVSREIPYTGGDGELDEGDGLLKQGRKLFVVENQDNRVTVVRLRRGLASGRIVKEIDSPLFNVPTTIARSGRHQYVVNAKFGQNTPNQTYEVVRVPKR